MNDMGKVSGKPLLSELRYLYIVGGWKAVVKRIVRPIFAKLVGLAEYEEQIDTLHYFLNQYIDICSLPKATGSLRELQEADEALLQLFHAICVRHGLTYWLDYGTLLGAVRHKGFIPWDDDMDVAMPRDMYDKAKQILKDEFARYGVVAEEDKDEPLLRIGVGYLHESTGVWLDVFPVDSVCLKENDDLEKLYGQLVAYRTYYYKNKVKVAPQALASQKEKLIGKNEVGHIPNGKDILYHGPEFIYSRYVVHERKTVYPLEKMEFEGTEYFVPHDSDAYLRGIYGDLYMGFPKTGVEHHGQGKKLSSWAADSNTDMRGVKRALGNALEDYLQL